MMRENETYIDKISYLEHKLVDWITEEFDKGKDCVDTKEAGEVIDMIKDLASAKKDCREAAYYESVTNAMGEYEEDSDYMGYNPNRSARTGRYTSKSNGRMGFRPYVDPTPYLEDYLDDGEMDWGKKPKKNARKGFRPMSDSMTDDRYGKAYNEYKDARRNYTETNSMEDKEAMKQHASAHIADTITTIREIWSNADSDLKKRMKSDFQSLINEMNA